MSTTIATGMEVVEPVVEDVEKLKLLKSEEMTRYAPPHFNQPNHATNK